MDRSARQHLDMEDFFAGFTLRTPSSAKSPAESFLPQTETPSFDALLQTISQCALCELAETRTQTVPGEGHPQADILFVGEAPGADEDALGRPFVGRAGQLLDRIIGACGLTREQVFIANILKCRPPGNRDPKADEIFKCMPYLVGQIELIEPKVIVALGAHAARTLLNTEEGIGRLRGRFHDCHLCPSRGPIKLMPTYHPAYLLRNYTPDTRRRVWEDMKKVLAEIGLPSP